MALPLELGGIRDPAVRRAFEILAMQFPVAVTGGGGGGAPSGPAGGVLGGTYPNPGFAADMATQAELDAHTTATTGAHGGIVASTDPRLTDARAPTAHRTTHEPGGTDAMTVDAAAATGSLRTIGTGPLQATAGNDTRLTNARTPTAHATSHQPGGTDVMAVDAVAATGSLRTLGPGAQQAASGTDTRFPAGADIVDADVSATAAIAESKLNLATDAAAGTGSRRTLGTTATSAAAGNRGMPAAGTTGQALVKNTATDYDASWTTLGTGGPPSGAAGGDLAGSYPNPTIAARAYWRLRLTANTASIANAGTLAIAWTQEDADTFGLHAASATTVVIGRAGTYLVGCQIFTGAAGMTVEVQTNAAASALDPGSTNVSTGMYTAVGLLNLAAAATVRVLVTNNSGGAQVVVGNTTNYQAAKFWGYWMGP